PAASQAYRSRTKRGEAAKRGANAMAALQRKLLSCAMPRAIGAAVLGAALGACSAGSDPAAKALTGFSAEIIRTAYGVPHIRAGEIGGMGFGYGYASAQDNVCEIADRLLTVSGERAKFLGPGEKDANIASDLYHRRMIASGRVEALLAG